MTTSPANKPSRRLYLVASCLAGLVLTGLGVQWLLSLQPGITRANFNRIHEGATLKWVA
jgi:hypothetical protein